MQFANVQLQCCASWSRRHQFHAVKWLLANKASALYNARDYCLLKLWKTVRKDKCSAVVERQRQVPFIVVWKWAPGVQPYKIVGAASSVWLLQCYKPTAVLCRCVSAYVLVFCFNQCVQWCSAYLSQISVIHLSRCFEYLPSHKDFYAVRCQFLVQMINKASLCVVYQEVGIRDCAVKLICESDFMPNLVCPEELQDFHGFHLVIDVKLSWSDVLCDVIHEVNSVIWYVKSAVQWEYHFKWATQGQENCVVSRCALWRSRQWVPSV